MNVTENRKTKKQVQQEKRLGQNIKQHSANKKITKKMQSNNKNQAHNKANAAAKKGGISAAIKQKIFGTKEAPLTAQQSIPYREIKGSDGCLSCRPWSNYKGNVA